MWDFLDRQGLLLTHDQRRARTDIARELEKNKENEAAAGDLEQSNNLHNLMELQKIQRAIDELYVSQWKTKVIFSREMQADQDRFLEAQRKIEATTRKIPL